MGGMARGGSREWIKGVYRRKWARAKNFSLRVCHAVLLRKWGFSTCMVLQIFTVAMLRAYGPYMRLTSTFAVGVNMWKCLCGCND